MPAFFFLSGLLVGQSLDKSPSRKNFLWKRFIRLYPAATIAVLMTALVLGPLLTTLSLRAYFSDPLFFQYLRTGLLIQVFYFLPGVFGNSPLGRSVNSSLWSLSLEWKCYAGLFLLSFFPPKTRNKAILVLLLILLIASFFYPQFESAGKKMIHTGFVLYPYSRLALFFLTGTLCYQYSHSISIHAGWIPLILLLGAIAAYLNIFSFALFLLLPAGILCLAVFGTRLARSLTPKPDLSYGLYVWGFPAEQLTINYLHPSNASAVFGLTLLLTLPLAAFSWYCIESPALKIKKAVR